MTGVDSFTTQHAWYFTNCVLRYAMHMITVSLTSSQFSSLLSLHI